MSAAPDHPVSPEHMIAMVSESTLFHKFNSARLLNLRDQLEFVNLEPGDVLFNEGDAIDSLFILVHGELHERSSFDSKVLTINRTDFEANPGVGAKRLLTDEIRVSTVTAATRSGLVKLSKNAFMNSSFLGLDHVALQRDILKRLLEGELKQVLVPMFGLKDMGMFDDLVNRLEWVHCGRGENLYEQGDESDGFYVLMSGRLQVLVRKNVRDKAKPVDEFSPGSPVGEMGVTTGERRTATVIASRDSELVRFSKQDFDDLAVRYPQLWRHLTKVIVRRLRKSYLKPDRKTLSSNILIAPATNDLPLADLADHLKRVLAETQDSNGSCLLLTSDDVDRSLGVPNIAQSTPGARHELRLRVWLTEQEKNHSVVLLVADPEVTEWTSRCIRRADEVMYVAAAGTKPETGRVAQEVQDQEEAHQAGRRKSLVLLYPKDADRPRGTAAWLDEFGLRNSTGSPQSPGRHFHIRNEFDDDYERLSRFVTRQEVGLVLSGGGARGFAHVGCIRAMREQGIPIDMIGGVSMGSVVAAAYAHNPEEFDKTIRKVKSQLPGILSDKTIPVVSVYRGRRFDRRLKNWFGDTTQIEDLWLPYFCVTSNLTRAEIYVHDTGPLWWAVRASGTLPGITTPVVHDQQLLFDGCLLDNLPMDVMRERMYESHVVAVDVVPEHDLKVEVSCPVQSPAGWWLLLNKLNPFAKTYDLPNIFSILQRAGELGSVYGRKQLKEGNYADLYLEPSVAEIRIADFKQLDHSEKLGYDDCGKELKKWWSDVRSHPAG
jgi:lysophospholipid hydrolase